MEKAFLLRPRISVRLRIVAGLMLCFFLLGVAGLINLATLYQARGKLRFLDISQYLSLDIQHARHLERLNFPDPENLRAARESAKNASRLLVAQGADILDVEGEKELVSLNYHLGHYVQALDDALRLAERSSPDPTELQAAAKELDTRSGSIMSRLRQMNAREAEGANHVLKIAQELPFIFGGVMLLIIFWVTRMLAKTITDALRRVEQSVQRIVAGDYTLLNPVRRYRDELSDLPLAINRIVLELRARESQVAKADKLASVGALATGIAEQIHGVFAAIQSHATHASSDPAAHEQCSQCQTLNGILTEAERGRKQVEGLLEFMRDEGDHAGPVNLAELIRAAQEIVQPEMAAAGVTFDAELPEDLPPAWATFGQLKQVFVNLFHNAVQAMPRGGALSVRAGFFGENGVEITVADQGVGISPQDLPHLFDPFYIAKEHAKGSGLGLSISYWIMKKLGGDIQVGSAVGKGTTVRLTLALAGHTQQTASP